MQAIDLFSGAGGMSTGAEMAGISVNYAVELDKFAAQTFAFNHKATKLFNTDIRTITSKNFEPLDKNESKIIFGGPPCQGFSTSNQKNRNLNNPNNWLYKEYIRLVDEVRPDWVVFENVKGLIETENGYFLDAVLMEFKKLGYTTSHFVLNSVNYGVPQKRNRLFILASLHGVEVSEPISYQSNITVREAIEDLPDIENGNKEDVKCYPIPPTNSYSKMMRVDSDYCTNNLITKNATHVIERYTHIPQGSNWESIPKELMHNYSDVSRCHTGIYRRLKENEPSVVIGNYRKNMLIHPWKNRGLSVREAARLQSIPDKFRFFGSIGFQQQQVGNLVPPLLAKTVFNLILNNS
ncbi:MAG TPA: DNA cytosine methyltransferase [Methylotenera sp.]